MLHGESETHRHSTETRDIISPWSKTPASPQHQNGARILTDSGMCLVRCYGLIAIMVYWSTELSRSRAVHRPYDTCKPC